MVSGFLWIIVIGMEQVMHINTLHSIIYECGFVTIDEGEVVLNVT